MSHLQIRQEGQIRQKGKTIMGMLRGKLSKQVVSGIIAAGCTMIGLAPQADAHWWNRCYTRAHYAVPSCYGWSHYGFASYSFPSYAHWYSFGPACYRPLAYYHVAYRPIVYRPVVYRPIVYRPTLRRPVNVLVAPDLASVSNGFGFVDYDSLLSTDSRFINHHSNDWGGWESDWGTESAIQSDSREIPFHSEPGSPNVSPIDGAQRSVAKPKAKPYDLKNITWEEAIYGVSPSPTPVRLVAFSKNSSDVLDAGMEYSEERALGTLTSSDQNSLYRLNVAPIFSEECALVDEMVLAGNSSEAYQALQSFVPPGLGFEPSLQVRHAVLSLFASKDPIAVEVVLDRFNSACAAGAELDEQSLGCKVTDYLAPARVDVLNTLNEFSKLALRTEESNVPHLLIVATLLRLDGQLSRSKVFAQSAFEQAAESGSMQWNSLITKLLQ